MPRHDIYEDIKQRIIVLDGGMGSLIQAAGLTEEDFRGEQFASWSSPLKGCNDVLVLTRPDVIADIHRRYLEAGADIISTDTFNANAVSLADYGLQDWAYRINKAGAGLARKVAGEYMLANPDRRCYVSGSVGPTSRSASISTDINNTANRDITFAELVEVFTAQIEGLIDGGADIIQLETFFDTLNCKAAIFAAETLFAKKGVKLPLIVSGTLTDSGRTLSGQTVEAFYASVAHAAPLAVGFNCSFGARQLLPYAKRLAEVSRFPISVYPNAGLPNISGGYDETPQMMADAVGEFLKQGLVNIVGGCCGTTPEHIALIAEEAAKYQPRTPRTDDHEMVLSGLEPLRINSESNFTNIGERTNVAGSAKFARLIREEKYEEALAIARRQVEDGSGIIDICFDDGMIDGPSAMTRFLNMAAAEPDVSKVPFMIDSSSWEVLESGLRCTQGKSVVNSISLKEGESEFLRRAGLIRRYGAAAVVMLFDERGQADVYERKIEVAQRAYNLLMDNGFAPEDIIFDPNVLAVATGIEAHNSYGRDFIEACRWIRNNLPHANISGGVSNLSFAFRGIDKVRGAMHSVFLYHAIEAGMNMGIVNPAMIDLYDDIEPELRQLAEDVILDRDPDAPERLAAYAERARQESAGGGAKDAAKSQAQASEWRNGTIGERISYAMLKGVADHIEDDAREAFAQEGGVMPVIDTMFMPAMEKVGELFGAGKMFLPQVVKTARVMKKGVGALLPLMENGQDADDNRPAAGAQGRKIVIATVKGDVHDIGKNIVSVVMSCNGYRIEDLGVMVECDRIVDTAIGWGADAIGLSALITPSLDEMIKVVQELERRGSRIPVIVGGATTSGIHTAVKIAPEYSGAVIHSRDASENIVILNKLFSVERETYLAALREEQSHLRDTFHASRAGRSLRTLTDARANGHRKHAADVVTPAHTGLRIYDNYPIARVKEYIDWTFFFNSWGLKGRYPDILDSAEKGEEARKLLADAQQLLTEIESGGLLTLRGVAGIFPATRRGDDIVVEPQAGQQVILPQLRNQSSKGENLSLADFVFSGSGDSEGAIHGHGCACCTPQPKTGVNSVADAPTDHIGMFALSGGIGLKELSAGFRSRNDDYNAIMSKLLADRLTEAFGEALHEDIRRDMWGYERGPKPSPEDILAGRYQGLRMAFGYPASPDHSLKREVFELLDAERNAGLHLNGNYMIEPGESLCGLIFADRDIRYFDIGQIDGEQISDYARRRQMTEDEIRKLLPRNV